MAVKYFLVERNYCICSLVLINPVIVITLLPGHYHIHTRNYIHNPEGL